MGAADPRKFDRVFDGFKLLNFIRCGNYVRLIGFQYFEQCRGIGIGVKHYLFFLKPAQDGGNFAQGQQRVIQLEISCVQIISEKPGLSVFFNQSHCPENRGFGQSVGAKVKQPGNVVGQAEKRGVSFFPKQGVA